MNEMEFSGRAPGKSSKMADDWKLMHLENIDKLLERSKHDPWIRRAFDMKDHGMPWEYIATALMLALAEENERIRKQAIRLIELQPFPYSPI